MNGKVSKLVLVKNKKLFTFLFFTSFFVSVDLFGKDFEKLNLEKRGKVIEKTEIKNSKVEFNVGPIVYKEADSEQAMSGYLATSLLQLYGKKNTAIYDFGEELTSLSLAEGVITELKAKGYDFLYSCKGLQCGEKNGWSVYLNKIISGDEESQYYIAAKKNHKNGSVTYRYFYAINIDLEPRLQVTTIVEPVVIFNVNDIEEAIANDGKVSFPALTFASGSASLTPQSFYQLRELADYLSGSGIDDEYIIAGHADKLGLEEINNQLSVKRAESVKRELVQFLNVSDSMLSVKGFGSTEEVVNDSEFFQIADRRVELIRKSSVILSGE